MKILLINWRCIKNPEAGGAEIHLHEIFRRIVAAGHSVTLVSHHFRGAPKEELIDGIKVRRIGNVYLFHFQFKRFYLSELKNEQFDLVVDDISKIPLNTPTYIHTPIVAILPHLHGKSLYWELPFPLAYYICRREQAIPRYYSNTPIFTISSSTRNELAALGQPLDKMNILYIAIDHDLFDSKTITKSPTPLLTYVGRIKKYKRIEIIIDAMPRVRRHFPDVKLQIGGTGDHLETLKRYVTRKGLVDSVRFLGYVQEEIKPELMGSAWLFVIMSAKEGWGITVTEANAAGTPAVGANVPGLRDSIVDGKTGLLVDRAEPDALADSIISLLGDKERLTRMSEEARLWSRQFTWDNSAQHFLQCVKDWFPGL